MDLAPDCLHYRDLCKPQSDVYNYNTHRFCQNLHCHFGAKSVKDVHFISFLSLSFCMYFLCMFRSACHYDRNQMAQYHRNYKKQHIQIIYITTVLVVGLQDFVFLCYEVIN